MSKRLLVLAGITVAVSLMAVCGFVVRDSLPLFVDAYNPVVIRNSDDVRRQNSILGPRRVSIRVDYLAITSAELATLLENTSVVDLDVTGCTLVDDKAFQGPGSSRELEVLRINGTSAGADLSIICGAFQKLRRLEVRNCRIHVLDRKAAGSMRFLWSLECGGAELNGAVIEGISAFPALQRLSLNGARGLSSVELHPLSACGALRELNLDRLTLDLKFLEKMCSKSALTWLSLLHASGVHEGEIRELQRKFPAITIQL